MEFIFRSVFDQTVFGDLHIPLCDHQVNSLKAVSSAKLFPQRSEPLELPFRSAITVYKRKLDAI
jgi:hypothetical protein